MTLVTGTVESIAGAPDPARWVFASPTLRESSDGDAVVTTKRVTATPVDSVVTVELDPGPCVVTHKNASYGVTIPDTDVDLWDLIGTAVGLPPTTSDAALEAAIAAYFELHPVEGGGGSGGASLSVSRTATTVTVASDSGTDATVPAADGTSAGVMTAAMQTKLAGISGTNTGDQNLSGYATTASMDTALAARELIANKGAVSGYAPLDSSQLVPAIYLPSYVDDVLEGANLAAFPGTGVTGKIYVALDSNRTYRWSGSGYTEIVSSPGSTDAVVEGSSNLYYTDVRADARVVAGITGKLDTSAAPELIRDTIGTALVAGSNVTITPNDAGDTITVAASGGGGGGDVTLTGVQTLTGKTIGDNLSYTTQGSAPATPSAGTTRIYAGATKGVDALGYLNSLGTTVVLGRDVIFLGSNVSGSTITKGTPVYIPSASSATPNIAAAQASAAGTRLPCAGLAAHDIGNNSTGMVLMKGVLSNVNTGGMVDGSALYVSATLGAYTPTKPAHPIMAQAIGYVEDANASTGSILVNVSVTVANLSDGVNGASFAVGDGTGSAARTVLFKNSQTGTLTWTPTAARTLTLPDITGTVATAADVALRAPLSLTLNTQTGTSYTLALGDAGCAVEMNNAAANTLTVPPNSSVAFPTGTVIEVTQMGAGQTTLTPGSGVTLRSRGAALRLNAQYAVAALRKRGTDEWVVAGDTSA